MAGAQDTIFAIASGAGRAAVAVLRISGPATRDVLGGICHGCPPPRRASLRSLRDGDREVLDRAVVLWMPGPGSYTGEDSAELHLHGGAAVVEAVSQRLVELRARPAEAGEFTRRAFLHGRMDLLEAEAVADLVDAETSTQRRQALRQLQGALGGVYRDWSDRLVRILAQQEALIDFPDEGLPSEVESAMLAEIGAMAKEISRHLDDGRRGERLREGLVFAVAGAPNVGKSTLVNALAGRDVAIVGPVAGTTRDVLEARVVLGGVPVTLLDTAGWRFSDDPIEAEGVRRAKQRAEAADLVVLVADPACPPPDLPAQLPRLVIANKADLGGLSGEADITVSALTGFGLERLRERLCDIARDLTKAAGPPALTRARHRAALQEAVSALSGAEAAMLPEIRGEELRAALNCFGRITGRVGVEGILDQVFGQFCIGK
jgi:tRNA modification GTPase